MPADQSRPVQARVGPGVVSRVALGVGEWLAEVAVGATDGLGEACDWLVPGPCCCTRQPINSTATTAADAACRIGGRRLGPLRFVAPSTTLEI